jgi:hypothetical protein
MPPKIEFPTVFHLGVLRELLPLISAKRDVLEIGSTDFSFRGYLPVQARRWLTVDFIPPADI